MLLTLLLISKNHITAQKIELDHTNKTLNDVLLELRDKYDIKLSFDHNLLRKYKVNYKGSHENINDAIEELIKGLPIKFKIIDNMIVLYHPKKELEKKNH